MLISYYLFFIENAKLFSFQGNTFRPCSSLMVEKGKFQDTNYGRQSKWTRCNGIGR
jgi:hypothetical protein